MTDPAAIGDAKRRAAVEAAEMVEAGMKVGLGTGTTVGHLLPALAARSLDIVCVATSPATATAAAGLGIRVEPFDTLDRLDITIDGADQVTPDRWLVKGGGAAHTREKVVAAAADRFVVIVSEDKLVDRLVAPVPLELMAFGLQSTLHRLGPVEVRPATPLSPDGGVIADWTGALDDPERLSAHLATTAGVVAHGLFPPAMVADVVIGRIIANPV